MVQGLEVETLAGEAARQLFRVWWEEAENKAEEQALEVHRLALIGGDEAIAVIVANEIAATWLVKSRFKEAINLCETTLEEFQHHVTLSRLAQAKSFVGKTKEAVSYYQQASELRPSFDSESMPYEQAVIMDGVELLLGFTNIEELYNNQENVLLNLHDTHDKAVQTINLADLSIQIGDIERALDLLQQASKISENVTSPGIESRILNSKGSALRHQGKLEQALSLYHKALEILKVINNDSAKSMILSNIALTLVEQGKCDAATEYFHQASKIFERIGDINGKAILLNNLALSVQAQGNVDYAVSLWMQSVKVLAQVGNYPKLVTFLGNLGVATTQIVYSSQAVWLCLQSQIFQVPLDEAITVLNDLFHMLPDGDPLESLVAATSLFLYNAADNYQQQNELKDLCNRMWGVVAKRNGIRSIPEWQSWTVQHQLDNPQVVIPKLLVQLEMLVGDRWLFDREKI